MADGAVARSTKPVRETVTELFEHSSGKAGYPAQPGQDMIISIRLPDAMIEAIDAWAARNSVRSRSDAIRMMIDGALNDRRKSPRLKLLLRLDESDETQ
jgi:Arc/MetJ-type ribon-helix-helix transcriptional regulator